VDLVSPLSNGYAVTANYLSLIVVLVWFKPAMIVLKKWFYNAPILSYDLLIFGVWIGFVGEFLDGLYWQIAWTLHYYQSTIGANMVDNGMLINMFTRQSTGTLAAYCHIKSSLQYEGKEYVANDHATKAVIMGAAYAFVMMFTPTR